jgi:WD40 repeat protein/predicted Ser/Thr protein kinase
MIDRTQTASEIPPAPSPSTDAPPGYAIEREIGSGGMGVVYLARQAGLNRPVVLKMIRAGGTADPKALIRFLAEAEAVAAVRHPNVVEVYAYGDHAGRPYLAMEFCPGDSLDKRIKAGDRFDPRAAATLVAAVADGVGAAHALNIVHRDLKPHNILLGTAGEPKVSDFGLAKRGVGADLTHTGQVMGTPAYMSPEQAGGGTKFVGPAADVWALGVMLYELLAGTRPFVAESSEEVLAKVLHADPEPIHKRLPDLPRDLGLICGKCLEKNPTDRYPTAVELATDLRRFVSGEAVGLRSVSWAERTYKWAKRKPTAAAAWAFGILALGFGGGGAAAGWLWREAEAARTLVAAEKQQTDEALTRESRARDDEHAARGQAEAAFTREQAAKNQEAEARRTAEDATRRERAALDQLTAVRYARTVDLAYREYRANDLPRANRLLAECPADRRGWEWEYVNRRCNADHLRLDPKAGPAYAVGYDTTGQRLVTAHADRKAYVWDATAGTLLRTLAGHGGEVRDVTFTPDGRGVVTASEDGKVRLWADGTENPAIFSDPASGPPAKTELLAVAVSPNGREIAAGGLDGKLRVWPVGLPDRPTIWTPDVGEIQAVRYSPDGKWLVVGGRSGRLKKWELGTANPPAELAAGNDHVAAVAFSGDSKLVAAATTDGMCRVWGVTDGRQTLAVQAHPSGATGVVFTPDGKRLVTCGRDRAVGVYDATSGVLLGTYKGHTDSVWGVVIDPTGRKIAAAGLDGTTRVWDLAADQEWRSFQMDSKGLMAFAVSPDSRWLVSGGKAGTVGLTDLSRERVVVRDSVPTSGNANPPTPVYKQPPAIPGTPPPQEDDGSEDGEGPVDATPRPTHSANHPQNRQLHFVQHVVPHSGKPPEARHELAIPHTTTHIDLVGVGRGSATSVSAICIVATSGHDPVVVIDSASVSGQVYRIRTTEADKPGLQEITAPTSTAIPTQSPYVVVLPAETSHVTRGVMPHGNHFHAIPSYRNGSVGDAVRAVVGLAGGRHVSARATPNGSLTITHSDGVEWRIPSIPFTVGAIGISAGGGRLVAAGIPNSVIVTPTEAAGGSSAGIRIPAAFVWDIKSRARLAELWGHTGDILSACFSPDGGLVATASKDNTARLWDAKSGRQLQMLTGHLFWVRSVAFSPDARRVVTGGMDGTIKLWDTATGSELLTLPAQPDGVTQVGFTPDGRKLLASGFDGTLRVFDAGPLPTQTEAAPPPRPAGAVSRASSPPPTRTAPPGR